MTEPGFFQKLFTPNNQQPPPVSRTFYVREDDQRVELIKRLKTKITACEREIRECDAKVTAIDEQLLETKRTYDKYSNKKSPQAVALQNKGGRLMAEKQLLVDDRNAAELQRTTLNTRYRQLTNIVNVEEMNLLTNESTLHIQKAIGNIDLHTAKKSSYEAKAASKTVEKLNDYIMNPLDLDLEENTTVFNDAFTNLTFGEDEFLDIDIVPVNVVEKKPLTNKPIAQSILDDDGF